MAISILFVALIALCGMAVTYLLFDDEPLMFRLAAGNVIGCAIFGTLAFMISSVAGFNAATMLVSLAIFAMALFLFRNSARRDLLRGDWQRSQGKLRGANARKAARFAYYFLFLILFAVFFSRVMWENEQGIFTGGTQNLGDLSFHLGVIFGFVDGNNFPPQNPSFAGARFSYPFVADFLTACFMRLGSKVDDAMFVQNVSWAFSLLVIFERFILKLTNDRLAARIGPSLLFFSGGLGFLTFFTDYAAQGRGFYDFLWHLPADYTIGPNFRWGNSMVVLFLTQRSLLLGMPLALVVLSLLWKAFTTEAGESVRSAKIAFEKFPIYLFAAGLLAGLLPLIHLHSLAVLFVVGVFLFVLKPEKWLEWATFAVGVCVTAIPELLWTLAGSASETSKFFAWHFGWDKGEQNFVWFWLLNTGIFIPAAAAGIYLATRKATREEKDRSEGGKAVSRQTVSGDRLSLLLFSLPFIFLFVVSNTAKLAPWEWDNIKVLIYWFVGMIPFAAIAITWLWRRSVIGRIAAISAITILTLSGALDVWRTVSRQINIKVFERDSVTIARRLKQSTPQQAFFVNAPTYNSAIVLTGRRSLIRYTGHLSSHGINYAQRESDVKEIYKGGPAAENLMRSYGVNYVLISPEERNSMQVNEQFFSKFPVAAESGAYRVYRVQ